MIYQPNLLCRFGFLHNLLAVPLTYDIYCYRIMFILYLSHMEGGMAMPPLRYFILNKKTETMHIQGYCRQTQDREIPIRLFDTPEALEAYAGRSLTLCLHCQRALAKER